MDTSTSNVSVASATLSPHDVRSIRHTAQQPAAEVISTLPDPTVVAVDTLSARWEDRDVYAFPPTPLISRILTKLENFAGEMTLIVPRAHHRAWLSRLLDRRTQRTLQFPVTLDLLRQPLSGTLRESQILSICMPSDCTEGP